MKILLIGCCMICTSCAMLNKEKSAEKNVQHVVQDMKLQEVAVAKQHTLTKENSSVAFELLIKPKGIFKLDRDLGFEGEAYSLAIKGNRNQLLQISERLAVQAQKNINLKQKSQQVATQSSKQIVSLKLLYGVIVFCSLLVLLLLYWLYRKWR